MLLTPRTRSIPPRTRVLTVGIALALAVALPGSALAAPPSRTTPTTPSPTVSGTAPGETVVPPAPEQASDEVSAGRRADQTTWGEGTTTATLGHVASAIGADLAHQQQVTGAGIGLALIDTGVAPVPGLTDVYHGPDLSLDSPFPEAHQIDAYGHGTHLAGVITGDRSDARGIAPDATLVSVKVGAHNGAVDVSQTIAGIDWVVQHRDEHNIRVLVLAYGTDGTQDPLVDPLAHAVQTAWHHGIVVVVAAGNDGATRPQVVNPATDPYVITVGALDTMGTARNNDDVRPEFSAPGTAERRPDVVAPGAGIVSSSVPGSFIEHHYPAAIRPGGLLRGNGTSQAAAVVGGAAALLLQTRPSLTPDQVKALLTGTATPVRGNDPGTGAGIINLWWARTAPTPTAVQTHPLSLGTGTLEGARGSNHLVGDGVVLQGEMDIMGQTFDSTDWAQAATAGTSWQDGTWNGSRWTGVGWNGRSWNGWQWNDSSWGGWSWNDLSWAGWQWNGWQWNGWSWNGWQWNGWSWNGWSWNGWSWNGFQWD